MTSDNRKEILFLFDSSEMGAYWFAIMYIFLLPSWRHKLIPTLENVKTLFPLELKLPKLLPFDKKKGKHKKNSKRVFDKQSNSLILLEKNQLNITFDIKINLFFS